MKMTRETVVTIKVNVEEKFAIDVVDVILRNIQDAFHPGCSFENMETGEIFDVEELARVRGILGALVDTNGNFRMRQCGNPIGQVAQNLLYFFVEIAY